MSVTAVPLQPVKQRHIVWVWIGIALALLVAAALAWVGTRGEIASYLAANAARPGVVTTASGLQYEVLSKGSGGPTPTDDDVTLIKYVGKFADDTVFDQTNNPTPLSPKQVVPGFGEALKLMPKGSRYRFWIKPELGYGSPRPAGAPTPSPQEAKMAKRVLVFDIDMIDFIPESVLRQMQMQQMMQGGAAGGPPGQMPPTGAR